MAENTHCDRFFYHSFPRRFKGGTNEVERGLTILSLMKKMGLLLVPEEAPWEEGCFTVQTQRYLIDC